MDLDDYTPYDYSNAITAQRLTYEDFENSINGHNYLDISESKRKLIYERFKKGGYIAFGVLNNNELVYASWLSLDELEIPGNGIIKIKENECFFLDDYCATHMRRHGIHKVASAERIQTAKNRGKKKASIVVLKENRPALKTQIDFGFKKCFSFYYIEFFKWNKSNFLKQYIKW